MLHGNSILIFTRTFMWYPPSAASALDTSSHDGFDERTNVLVLHSSFALCKAAPVTAKLHGLVLEMELE